MSLVSSGSGLSGSSFVFSCFFVAEEFDKIEDKQSRDITTFGAQIHLSSF
jgi:hypothetical protein